MKNRKLNQTSVCDDVKAYGRLSSGSETVFVCFNVFSIIVIVVVVFVVFITLSLLLCLSLVTSIFFISFLFLSCTLYYGT